jgi:hypothetical protein
MGLLPTPIAGEWYTFCYVIETRAASLRHLQENILWIEVSSWSAWIATAKGM